MRIESSIDVMAVQPIMRPQPAAQTDEATATLKLQLTAFHINLSGSGQAQGPDTAEAVRALNEAAAPYNISLHFSRDEATGAIIIKLVNQETGEVLNQIPDDARLHLSAVLGKLQGQLFARRA